MRCLWRLRFRLAGWAACFAAAVVAQGAERQVLDDFATQHEVLSPDWEVLRSDGVDFQVHAERQSDRAHATALRLDFDFHSAGYAGLRRKVPLELGPNFEIAFSIRGDLPPNNLELKLVDESGNNVWWVNRRAFEFPREWTQLASRRRHFRFAWGPSSAPLTRAGAIELVVASAEGGRGSVWLDDLTFRALPATKDYQGTPQLTASSQASDDQAAPHAADGQTATEWRSTVGDSRPTLTVDFGEPREFGGIVVDWNPGAQAASYEVQFSDDGAQWTTARRVATGAPWPQFLAFPDAEARAVRLVTEPAPGANGVAIRELEILPLDAASDANAFALEVARRAPRGHFPRAIAGTGTFWTIVGVPQDEHEALLSEDGALEVDKQAFSLEPFVRVGNQLLSWAESRNTQSLADGFAPVPTVTRDYDHLRLTVTPIAHGAAGQSSLTALYTLTNTSESPLTGKLLLALRPFQVNPPYQWLNAPGGVAKVERIALDESGRAIQVDGRLVALGEQPAAFGASTRDGGEIVQYLAAGTLPAAQTVTDSERGASAAIEYPFELAPGASHSWVVDVPFTQDETQQRRLAAELWNAKTPEKLARAREAAAIAAWTRATQGVQLLVPPSEVELVHAIRSTLAYILINQDGKAIHPGSRSYERSWIRDGSLTSAALLRFGLDREAKAFVDWYADYQFPSGKVPCVVDRRGADPVPENDSHGQYIMAVLNVYRFTGDREFLARHWPRVQQAVAYIEQLRRERMTAKYSDPSPAATAQEPGKPPVPLRAFYGLVPESISHEGYSAKPMHSYWDDFFTLKGLKDAAEIARVLDDPAAAKKYQSLADDFARTLYASLDLAMAAHGIDTIPGCVELGDFDATSTTIALWPCNEASRLPQAALRKTFDFYWSRFLSRRDDPAFSWVDYTPYELRVIGSLLLLGEPERAREALAFFMHDRRPAEWNQWPEVVHRDPRAAKFIGDLPHTWCGSDFVNSVRMMFLYEREADNAVVLLAGVPTAWLGDAPIGFRDLPTYGGRLTCTIERDPHRSGALRAQVAGTAPVPAGKLRLTVPLAEPVTAEIAGKPAKIDAGGRIVVENLPAEVTIVPKSSR